MSTTISGAAAAAESVLEAVMEVEPTIATLAAEFGGPVAAGAVATLQPEILFLVPFLENALKKVAASTDVGGEIDAVIELAKHLLPGQPNAPALAPTATPAA